MDIKIAERKRITFALDANLLKRLDSERKQHRVTRTRLIEHALTYFFETIGDKKDLPKKSSKK